jgi:uncharacterized protein YdeI (YjbR/CyaY-like superfamily)
MDEMRSREWMNPHEWGNAHWMKIRYFRTPAELRHWLAKHHAAAAELWVGFYKVDSGKPSVTWSESVGEALCFGWIDGVRKRIDELSYTIRFTPRRPGSTWSAINIRRVIELGEQGLMRPAGRKAFQARKESKSGIYSYEQRPSTIPEPYQQKLRKNRRSWEFFQAQAPWYRKTAGWWVISAKKEATRLRRLEQLIEDCANGRRIAPLRETPKA